MATLLMIDFVQLIGRLHPLLVHLPIGILLFTALLRLFLKQEKLNAIQYAINIALFWGTIGAIGSVITGYLLSQSGEYDESLVSSHQWFGISVAIVSGLGYFLNKKQHAHTKLFMLLLVVLIFITGHLGGSLTHGSDYLTEVALTTPKEKITARKPIPNIAEAILYTDIIKPILQANCYDCHGPNKQKAKLRLDLPDYILKGSKDGTIIDPKHVEECAFIKRLFLPLDNKDHMPPKEKPQLSKQDLELLKWWVSSGADFSQKVKEINQPATIKPVLLALQTGAKVEKEQTTFIPSAPVSPADPSLVKEIQSNGIAVFPVSQSTNYLSVNFLAVDTFSSKSLSILTPISKQLIWLKLSNTPVVDADLKIISGLSAITRLSLDRTSISDAGLAYLKNNASLEYLNLVGTKVTVSGLKQLTSLKNLKQIYLFQSGISAEQWKELKIIFPNAYLDSGGYKVPTIKGDTTEKKTVNDD
jgi:uncharacterized membrane protein/mono/diheme cytochrome c family protein